MADCETYWDGFHRWDEVYDDAWYRELRGELGAWGAGLGATAATAGAGVCWAAFAGAEVVTVGVATPGAWVCLGLSATAAGLWGATAAQSVGEEPEEREREQAEEARDAWCTAAKACDVGGQAPSTDDLPPPPDSDDDSDTNDTGDVDGNANGERMEFSEDELQELYDGLDDCDCEGTGNGDTYVSPPIEFDLSDNGSSDGQGEEWVFTEDDLAAIDDGEPPPSPAP
jgi:hypothetical protein